MREFRTGYFAAPCDADGLRKPGNVSGAINVRVQPCSTRCAAKEMLHPRPNRPAHRASLTGVGGVHKGNSQSSTASLVGDKVLKLSERPAMQSRPDALPGLDVGADVGQVFHADFARTRIDGFCNDRPANFVVHMLDVPAFAPGDSAQLAFRCTATVGLKSPAVGKVFIAVMPQLSAAPDLASAGCGEIIFTDINAHRTATGRRRSIGNIEDEVEIPDAFADDQPCFLRNAAGKQVSLVPSTNERNLGAAIQGEQGKHITFDRVGTLIEVYGCGIEIDGRNRLVLGDTLIGLERFVGVSNTVNRLANHLAAKRWEPLSHGVVGQMVQGDSVPAPMLNSVLNNRAARISKHTCQRGQRHRLIRGCQQLERYSTLAHIGHFTAIETAMQQAKPSPYLPRLNAGVSRRQ